MLGISERPLSLEQVRLNHFHVASPPLFAPASHTRRALWASRCPELRSANVAATDALDARTVWLIAFHAGKKSPRFARFISAIRP